MLARGRAVLVAFSLCLMVGQGIALSACSPLLSAFLGRPCGAAAWWRGGECAEVGCHPDGTIPRE